MTTFGLHLGNCSACLAFHRDGKTDVVANDLGDRVTPAVVAFTDHEISVGAAAKQGITRNAKNTVCNVKQILGHRIKDEQVQAYMKNNSVIVENQEGLPVFCVEHKGKQSRFTPERVVEFLYQKMLETAQSLGGSGNQKVVLAIPAGFTEEQRSIVSEAATKVGFNILRLINESSAAMLAYDIGQLDQSEHFKTLIYRLGGTSHDATLVETIHGMYRIISRVDDTTFGADKFTEVMQGFLANEFKRQNRCDMTENKRSVSKLHLASEGCKTALSTMISASCDVESLFDGCDFHCNVSRARFEMLIQPLMSNCTQLIEKLLEQAGCSKGDVAKVIVCGGGAKPPFVKKIIGDFLPSSTLLNSISEDEVIAVGAAKEAALLVDGDGKAGASLDKQSTVSFNTLPKAVGIRMSPTESEVILPQHSLAPMRRQHTYSLPSAQTHFAMELLQMEEANQQEAPVIARVVLKDLPQGSTVKSSFHLRREGDLHVTCHEVTSDKTESIIIPCH